MLAAGVGRLVYSSSIGVLGSHPGPQHERSPTAPDSLHRTTKLAAEQVLMAGHASDALPVVIARLPSVFGARCRSWLGLVRAIAAGRFRMVGRGDNRSHPGPVSDMVDALRRCAETPGVEGRMYVISGKEAVPLRDLVGMIAREVDAAPPSGGLPAAPFRVFRSLTAFSYKRWGFELPGLHRYDMLVVDQTFDISKAREELGYDPKISVGDCIGEMTGWYREHGMLP